MSHKPQWPTAPDWAQWLAQDATGRWWWYAAQPHVESTIQGWRNPWGTRVREAGQSEAPDSWFGTLEQRP